MSKRKYNHKETNSNKGLIVEWCSHCEEEVEIPAKGRSKCPNCGKPILPCSMCEDCAPICPYGEK